jgi:hypothetical protein
MLSHNRSNAEKRRGSFFYLNPDPFERGVKSVYSLFFLLRMIAEYGLILNQNREEGNPSKGVFSRPIDFSLQG